jgi:hypothetical protein
MILFEILGRIPIKKMVDLEKRNSLKKFIAAGEEVDTQYFL